VSVAATARELDEELQMTDATAEAKTTDAAAEASAPPAGNRAMMDRDLASAALVRT
jgi:hypothetical protein